MQWTDEELEERARQCEERMLERQRLHPETALPWELPYKVITKDTTHGVKRMRLIWLEEHHPDALDRLKRANVLEEHLKDIESRFLEARERIYQELMEQRGFLNRSDVMEAHPEITDQDRFYGSMQCEADSQEMAIHEIVESF